MFIVLDTETTSLIPGKICQLAYIKCSGSTAEGINHYYSVDYISPSAAAVNGLSVELLSSLSGGRTFADTIEQVRSDMMQAEFLVAHNFNFDLSFLMKEFSDLGISFLYKKAYCTMRGFTDICKLVREPGRYKYPKLEELIKFCGFSDFNIIESLSAIFGISDKAYHDARYDAVATYRAFMHGAALDHKIRSLIEYTG